MSINGQKRGFNAGRLRIPIRGYELTDDQKDTLVGKVTNPYKGL